jgi:ribonucleotide monophosphatase NagD (HAD superfamily)
MGGTPSTSASRTRRSTTSPAAARAGGDLPPDDRIVCVGDGVGTDVLGAAEQKLDCVFVTGGLAARETGTPTGGQPDPERLALFAKGEGLSPRYAIGFLR